MASEEANPKSSALPASLTLLKTHLGWLPAVHSTQNSHGAGLFTARSAWRGLQKDYLRKKWAQFVLTPLLFLTAAQQPKAENWQAGSQLPRLGRPAPNPFDLPLSKAIECSSLRPCLQEPRGEVRTLESGSSSALKFLGQGSCERRRYWKKD